MRRGWRALALLPVLLGGCALLPRPAHLRQDGAVVPPDTFLAVDGGSLPARVWTPARFAGPVAVVLALHGYQDSRDAWEGLGPFLAARGIATVAVDQRGFGAAPGRGHWPGSTRLVEDAASAAADVQRRFPRTRLFVMGESMGGAVALCLAASDLASRRGVTVAGTILLAPAVWSRAEMSPLVRAFLAGAVLVAPDYRLTGNEVPLHVMASDDRAALIRLARDPLTLPATSVSMIAGLVDIMSRAAAAAGQARGPVLIASGAHDQLVPARATRAVWLALPTDARRAYYANGYHLMVRDRDRFAVEQDIASWIAHPGWPLPSGADVQAAAWVAQGAPDPEPSALLPAALDDLGAGADPVR